MSGAFRVIAVVLALGCSACTVSGSIDTGDDDGGGDPTTDSGVDPGTDGGPSGGDTASGGADTRGGGGKDSGSPGSDTAPPGTDTAPPPADTTPPPVDTGPVDPGDPYASARVTCVDEINKYRATEGKPPYAGWSSANSCVDGEAKADSISGVAHSAFGKCGEFAQNECPGWPGPPDSLMIGCLKMMWDEGPGTPFSAHGHYINMSSTSYTSVSCGFFQTPSGSYWAAQDFK